MRLTTREERENDEEIDDVATYLGPVLALLFAVGCLAGFLVWATSN